MKSALVLGFLALVLGGCAVRVAGPGAAFAVDTRPYPRHGRSYAPRWERPRHDCDDRYR